MNRAFLLGKEKEVLGLFTVHSLVMVWESARRKAQTVQSQQTAAAAQVTLPPSISIDQSDRHITCSPLFVSYLQLQLKGRSYSADGIASSPGFTCSRKFLCCSQQLLQHMVQFCAIVLDRWTKKGVHSWPCRRLNYLTNKGTDTLQIGARSKSLLWR